VTAAPAVAPAAEVLRRVASEVGAAADGLALVEVQVAALLGAAAARDFAAEKLQALDHLTQQMRAIEVFLCAVALDANGEVSLAAALDSVLLEETRARLAGLARVKAAEPEDVELW
jgi:hypothetical protein